MALPVDPARAAAEGSPEQRPAVEPRSGGGCVYIYGIARGCRGVAPPSVEGIAPGAAVRFWPDLEPCAVISMISSAEASSLADRGGHDGGWAAERALAHHRVLEATAQVCPVAPMKFGVALPDLSEVERLLAANGALFEQLLDRVEGAREWGVKLLVDVGAFRAAFPASSPALDALKVGIEAAAPGKAFFLRRKMREAAEAQARLDIKERAARLRDALGALARETAPCRLGREERDAQGRLATPVLSIACLVDRQREAAFCHTADQLRGMVTEGGFMLRLTGPWPPYSFVNLVTEDLWREGH